MSRVSRSLLNMMAIGGMMSMQMNGEFERDRRRNPKISKPKVVGYDHKIRNEHELSERRIKKRKFREKRQRKGCRKGGKI